ncbi:MAG: hypothetical protein JEZ04_16045 [Spirochaetales bacterium]|nr:hypothetical protein [Spirochaetales bacterium]
MDSIILKSKICPPKLHSSYIKRPSLELKLMRAAEQVQAVSLIISPPGYGKTSLAASWIKTQEAVSWLTIGTADNVFNSFFRYLTESIKKNFPAFGKSINSAITSPIVKTPQYMAELFVYELEHLEVQLSMVIDNYQEIVDQNIHRFMTVFLDDLPENLHLLILSQEDPPLSIASLRLKENLIEIRQNDLSFGLEEIK